MCAINIGMQNIEISAMRTKQGVERLVYIIFLMRHRRIANKGLTGRLFLSHFIPPRTGSLVPFIAVFGTGEDDMCYSEGLNGTF